MTALLIVVLVVAHIVMALELFFRGQRIKGLRAERDQLRRDLDHLAGPIERALHQLWPQVTAEAPEDGSAVAVLRNAFLALPVPRGGKHKHAEPLSAVTCPKCEDPTCVARGECDDLFGGDAP